MKKIIFTLFLLIMNFILYPLEIIQLDDNTTEIQIISYADYFEDKSNKLTIDDITEYNIKSKFIRNTKKIFNIGYSTSTFWLMFKIKNESKVNDDFIIEIQLPYLTDIEFYYPYNNKFIIKKTGYFVPYNKRDEKNKNYVFSLKLLENEEKIFFIKISSEYFINLPVNIYSLGYYNKKEISNNFQSGFYYGTMIIILFINIIIFLFIRDKAYFYFLIFFLFVVLLQTVNDNLSVNIFFPDSLWFAMNRI